MRCVVFAYSKEVDEKRIYEMIEMSFASCRKRCSVVERGVIEKGKGR